ncbi:MAG: TIGR03617 family F420-dependent LLM class oxidoreductase [Chloroflexi bacterium]|nr:MAG: TIGR03617 family F420-dependent LLM class oxidoreductase [Chloroflexota bacterium]
MKIDLSLLTYSLSDIPALARHADALGFDGLWTSEAAHDPFLPLALAAEHTRRLSLGTAIALAFPRSPAVLAYTAWDLARFSQGRFILGLGTQVKAHNERRLGVKWEQPVEKLREVILALRAFWDCWQNGTRLNFRGEFFKLTLMSPFFNPGPHDYPDIPIYIAGVNARMCRLAGELCQGLHVHPLHTVRYLQTQIWPNIEAGLSESGRSRTDIQLASTVFVIPTDDPRQAAEVEQQVRRQIAFYASTPTYRPVLALHGWEAIGDRLGALAVRRRWGEMARLIPDDMLAEFAVSGPWAGLPALLRHKYGDLLDRVSFYLPFTPGKQEEQWQATIAGFREKG